MQSGSGSERAAAVRETSDYKRAGRGDESEQAGQSWWWQPRTGEPGNGRQQCERCVVTMVGDGAGTRWTGATNRCRVKDGGSDSVGEVARRAQQNSITEGPRAPQGPERDRRHRRSRQDRRRDGELRA